MEELVVAQLGVQGPSRDELREPLTELVALTSSACGPSQVDRAWHVDARGVVNEMLICYWTDPAEHDRWWASAPLATWWANRPLDGPLGWWREVLTSPVRRLETLFSAPVPMGPAAVAAAMDPTNVHDYLFAALDRIPESEHDDFLSEGKFVTDLPAGASPFGRVVTVTDTPLNLCLIRTAQDWSMAPDEQTESYRSLVEPGYREGVTYLRDNTSDSGCVGARLLRETDADGVELPRTSTVAWFGGIADLLRWAHHHPTHHRILGDFWTGLVEPYTVDLRLLLWHEVHVAPAGGVRMEYVNCHPGTGVLALA